MLVNEAKFERNSSLECYRMTYIGNTNHDLRWEYIDLHWEYKPYKLKRSFTKLLLTKTEKRSIFVLAVGKKNVYGLFTSVSTFLHFIKEIHRINGTLHPLTKWHFLTLVNQAVNTYLLRV